MVTEAQLKNSLKVLLRGGSLPASEDETERIFKALARIAPNCLVDPAIALGFISTVIRDKGQMTPKTVAEIAQAEKLLRELKTQPVGFDESMTLPDQLDALEKHLIERSLELHRRKGDAAKALGIPQSTLSTKLKKFGLRE